MQNKKHINKKLIFKIIIILILVVTSILASMNIFMKLNNFDLILKYSSEIGSDPAIIASMIHAESKFNKDAVSNKEAYGLMQITYDTFEFVKQKLNIEKLDFSQITSENVNIFVGTYYYEYLLNRFDGNIENALCAYNAGPTNVDNWLSDPQYSKDGANLDVIPFPETRNYVKKINRVYPFFKLMIACKI